jgi:hypothetical protein
MIHCTQFEHEPDDRWADDWIKEGLAAWGEAEITQEWLGRVAPGTRKFMRGWLFNPQVDLTLRAYDAIGYWALVKKQGLDPWQLLPGVVREGSSAGGSLAAYAFMTDSVDLTAAWGPSLAASPPAAPLWDLPSPAALPVSGPYEEFPLRNGGAYVRVVMARGGNAAALNVRSDVVRIEAVEVAGTFRPRGGSDQELFPEQLFCARPGGCRCDDGSQLPARRIQRGRALIGFHAPGSVGSVIASGERVDFACRNKPDLDPPSFDGISVNGVANLEGEGGPQDLPRLARFRAASCSVRGGRFIARATSAGRRLTITIPNYRGPSFNDGVYETAFGQPQAEVEFRGAGGVFSNRPIPRTGPAPNGPALFGEDLRGPTREILGLAGTLLIDAGSTQGVVATGVMRCRF